MPLFRFAAFAISLSYAAVFFHAAFAALRCLMPLIDCRQRLLTLLLRYTTYAVADTLIARYACLRYYADAAAAATPPLMPRAMSLSRHVAMPLLLRRRLLYHAPFAAAAFAACRLRLDAAS